MASSTDYLIVAAIDFGTTFSGYAFSTLDDHRRDPLRVCLKTWNAGSGGLISQKTSTCILFNPNDQFDSFGFEAENKYADLALEKKHGDWHYFRRFKMTLYENKFLNRDFQLEDDQGAKMPAMTVFSSSIKYLKNHMMETCRNQIHNIEDSDILWVLTVPAIWSDAAKQFMREAAEKAIFSVYEEMFPISFAQVLVKPINVKFVGLNDFPRMHLLIYDVVVLAGIRSCNLKIALEAEAASLYCKYLPNEKGTGGISSFGAGSKYLVLDAGGGTIDITVHQLQEDGSLKEIHKANGGDWGGTKVDNAYQALLTDIIGKKGYRRFCRKNKADMIELFRDFEIKKQTIKPLSDEKVNFKIPTSMNECCRAKNEGKDIQKIVKSSEKFKEGFSVISDKLRVTGPIARDLFKEPVRHIIDHLKPIMSDDIKSIVLVGGFSESRVLQSEVREAFPDVRIIVSPEAELAVLKGAVIFGHEPGKITTRVCKYTYGIGANEEFKEGVHDPSKMYTTSFGQKMCGNIYDIHVHIGDCLDIDVPQKKERYYVDEPYQKSIMLKVYASSQRDPMYTTDPGCFQIGKLTLDMADISRGLDRGADARMIFGNTELEVKATDILTGESVTATFDFLK